MSRASTPTLLRAAGTMAVATAVSRLTGFARTVVLVAAIGLGLVGDAYNTANTLPNVVYELLLGGVLTSVIVPLLVHARERDEDDGLAYTQRLLSLLTVGLVVATALAILIAPLLTYAYGIREDPEQVALANLLARILLVEIVFY
ncbi:MAG: murein biosynthesis integral membrane protein MurJ, partial [Actinomycetota bacterium]|nr:murein biosynthesis integral membrane protein MurJ [Actinomycetota bacterium]